MIATATVLDAGLFSELPLPPESRLPPFHLTWHVAAAYDWNGAFDALESLARSLEPFDVTIERAHIFSTDRFAVVGLLRESEPLESMHRRIIACLAPYAHHVDQRYARSDWLAHVTLASGLSQAQAEEVRERFDRAAAGASLTIDNVSFLSVEFGRFILSNVRSFRRSQ